MLAVVESYSLKPAQRHHLLEQVGVAPEQVEGLVEQLAVLAPGVEELHALEPPHDGGAGLCEEARDGRGVRRALARDGIDQEGAEDLAGLEDRPTESAEVDAIDVHMVDLHADRQAFRDAISLDVAVWGAPSVRGDLHALRDLLLTTSTPAGLSSTAS